MEHPAYDDPRTFLLFARDSKQSAINITQYRKGTETKANADCNGRERDAASRALSS
jgi:hypothetical protein